MIDGRAAGHDFKFGVCECGVNFVDIQDVTIEDVGKMGLTHDGSFAAMVDITDIISLAKKMREKINASFGWRD